VPVRAKQYARLEEAH